MNQLINQLRNEMRSELENNILPFWMNKMEDNEEAYRLLKKPEYLETATRAKRYLIDRFYDPQYGGIYWELDYKGNPLDTKKQIYAIGFAILRTE